MQIHQQLAATATAAVVLWSGDVNAHTGNSVTGDTLQADKQGDIRGREQLPGLPMTEHTMEGERYAARPPAFSVAKPIIPNCLWQQNWGPR